MQHPAHKSDIRKARLERIRIMERVLSEIHVKEIQVKRCLDKACNDGYRIYYVFHKVPVRMKRAVDELDAVTWNLTP